MLQPTIYQSRLLNFFGTFANECNSADRAAFVEALLGPLVGLSYAKDATARWRFCQLLHALMGNLPPESELSDELLDGFQTAMTERLEDGKPTVRAVAVRALARLPDPGEEGDFSGCELTASLIDMLGAEKSKAVRKAVLATLPFSDFTRGYYLQRTRDEADDVRVQGGVAVGRRLAGLRGSRGLGAAGSRCCCEMRCALPLACSCVSVALPSSPTPTPTRPHTYKNRCAKWPTWRWRSACRWTHCPPTTRCCWCGAAWATARPACATRWPPSSL